MTLLFFPKGYENARAEAGRSEPLQSRKRRHSWKAQVGNEQHYQRATPASILATVLKVFTCFVHVCFFL